MNEFLIKLVQNANNGGGNPYHDAEGKFTNGPNKSFNSETYNQFSDYEAPTGIGRYFKNEKAANTIDRALDGMLRASIALKNCKNSKEALHYLEDKQGKVIEELRKDLNKSLTEEYTDKDGNKQQHTNPEWWNASRASNSFRKAYNDVSPLFKKKSNLSKMKDSAKKEFRAEKINNEINKKIKDINILMTKNPNVTSAERLMMQDSLGMLQTLKYLENK